MNYIVYELVEIVRMAGPERQTYHNTVGVFSSVRAAKAYATARTHDSNGLTPLYWTDNSTNQAGEAWTAYREGPNRGPAKWQIIPVRLAVEDDHEALEGGESGVTP